MKAAKATDGKHFYCFNITRIYYLCSNIAMVLVRRSVLAWQRYGNRTYRISDVRGRDFEYIYSRMRESSSRINICIRTVVVLRSRVDV